MGQANGVSPTPWHKWELHNPVKFYTAFIFRFPVAVQRHGLATGLVNADDVRLNAIAKVKVRVDFKDGAQSIFVVRGVFSPLNFVIGD